MERRFIGASSPHLKSKRTTRNIMIDVLIALAPATVMGVVIFGWQALLRIFVSIGIAIGAEALSQYLMKKPITVKDCSAAITGLLLALSVPVTLPLWMLGIGDIIAIVIAKQFFGGIGHNFMNPALIGRAFIMACWPSEMAKFSSSFVRVGADRISGVTPLFVATKYAGAGTFPYGYGELFIGTDIAGCIGEVCKAALLAGAVYLLVRGVISYRIPLAYLLSFALLSLIPVQGMPLMSDPVYQLLSGGVLLGAFFMATDYSSSPTTWKGQLIMGVGCGVITFVIRRFGSYPEGVTYAILCMNMASPLIERFTHPKVFGEVKKRHA